MGPRRRVLDHPRTSLLLFGSRALAPRCPISRVPWPLRCCMARDGCAQRYLHCRLFILRCGVRGFLRRTLCLHSCTIRYCEGRWQSKACHSSVLVLGFHFVETLLLEKSSPCSHDKRSTLVLAQVNTQAARCLLTFSTEVLLTSSPEDLGRLILVHIPYVQRFASDVRWYSARLWFCHR